MGKRYVDQAGQVWEEDGNGGYRRPPSQAGIGPDPLKTGQVTGQIANTNANTQRTSVQTQGDLTENYVKKETAIPTIRKANAEASKAEADAKAAMGIERPLSMEQLTQLRDEAHKNLGVLDDLEKGSRKWFATGFGAPTLSNFGGTNAIAQKAKAAEVGAGGALSKVLEMAKANGGKNPLTPLSGPDVTLIGNSVANLDVGQPDEDYRKSVQRYRDFYWKIFNSADDKIIAQGGKTKNPFRLNARTPTANAPRKQKQSTVIDFNDWGK